MKRKIIALALAAGLSAALLGVTASSAQARDTTWGCPGCIVAHH